RCDQMVALPGPGEQVLQHHVVGEQDVRLAGEDPVPLLLALLAGVTVEGDRALVLGQPPLQEAAQLVELAVGERVHRVDDDRLDPARGGVPEDRVDDRQDVAEALAGSGPRTQHVAAAVPGGRYGLSLWPVDDSRSYTDHSRFSNIS